MAAAADMAMRNARETGRVALRATTTNIPQMVASTIDLVVKGTVAEKDLDVFFATVEHALVEIAGKDSLGAEALSKTFSSAVWASGLKGKIINIGNGEDVSDLARVAIQANDNDVSRAIDAVIAQPDPDEAELSKMMRIFLGAVIKLVPGLSETSVVIGLINYAIDSLGYTDVQDKVATLALVITRYPDRLYHFLRKGLTLATLQGHDVNNRVTQAEVVAIVWPILFEYFKTLSNKDVKEATAMASADPGSPTRQRPGAAAAAPAFDLPSVAEPGLAAPAVTASAAPSSQAEADADPTPTTGTDESASGSAPGSQVEEADDEMPRTNSGSLFVRVTSQVTTALQATSRDTWLSAAKIGATFMGGGYIKAFTHTASLANDLYEGHQHLSKERQEWNQERQRMLQETNRRLIIEEDALATHWKRNLTAAATMILLPVVVGAWNDIDMVATFLYNAVDPTHEYALVLGMDPIDLCTAMAATTLALLFSLAAWLFWDVPAWLSHLTSPSTIVGITFVARRLNTWVLVYSAMFNALKVLLWVVPWTFTSVVPPMIFVISSFSSLLKLSRLTLVGQLLPTAIVLGYVVGLTDVSFYIVTIAIGKMGQLLLEYSLKRPGLKRNVIMWCFDDLLTAMAPVVATTASPDDKLRMITPSPFACALVALLQHESVVLLGAAAGLVKVLIRTWWSFPLVVVSEAAFLAWRAYQSRVLFDDCWTRWKVLLPERVDNIAAMETFWRAYLQTRPNFNIAAAQQGEDGDYAVEIRVLPPWTPASEAYTVHYRRQPLLLSVKNLEWSTRPTPELESEEAFQRHVDSGSAILLRQLEMGSAYEVRVDAVLNGGKSVVRGTVLSCKTGHPRVCVAEDEETGGLLHITSDAQWDGVVTLRYRVGRWPWRYRESLLSLASPEFTLVDGRTCDINGLSPGSSVRVEFRYSKEGLETEWLPTQPEAMTLRAPMAKPLEPSADDTSEQPSTQVHAEQFSMTPVSSAFSRAKAARSQDNLEKVEETPAPEGASAAAAVAVVTPPPFRLIVGVDPTDPAVTAKAVDASPDLDLSKIALRIRSGSHFWRYKPSLFSYMASQYTLDASGSCVLSNLSAATEYEVQFQTSDGTWCPAEPRVVKTAASRPVPAAPTTHVAPDSWLSLWPKAKARRAVALYGYNAKHAEEASIERDDSVVVIADVDDNWVTVKKADGTTGNVPKNRLEFVSGESPELTSRAELVLD
mmetsp:Transcript_28316/g.74325  ORF Transcript_28316/g.74325 Transcript_28316/m.74325 type:complete len:1215 (+) Transcript_28316:98-3742(+)|eukprot:CAMPEP_0206325464 /NCGR_PEP_ID=MMETSP0106_2-20121207/21090_1 /ASSEMBLY_ACC=CAM_ASM_000206 /TAXON_ID=81532 /ORGANISM="Acanthoeca-like sp., Strain 10tr" /LENGTH=1214 /DNA_ID=CAMNT_0053757939 /DNA_START=84 /DNA_END=3728 /DNA_ORIENTATION=+